MEHPIEESAVAEPEVVTTEPESSDVESDTQTNDPASYYPDDPSPEAEPDEGEAEEEDDFEDEDDEEGEPEEDIAVPVGLKAEHKELFAQLPREAQRVASEIIGQREKDSQAGVQKAVLAQREAERSAADQVAETQRDYADRFEALASVFAPKPPDPRLAQQDPGQYIALKAQYDAEAAEFEQLKQQISGHRSEADQHFQQQDQQFFVERHQQLMGIPEYANEESRRDFLESIDSIGTELGYEPDEMANATFRDIVTLKRLKRAEEKAAKYDALLARRNERPRKAGKFAKAAPAGGQAPKPKQTSNPLASLYPNDV